MPIGAPGNLPDKPGATTGAVLTQFDTNAVMAGSGNLYNQAGVSSFALTDSTAFPLGTLVLQIRAVGSELDYASMLLTYSDADGTHSLPPLFRYELNRAVAPGQGIAVSSLWQWDLSGLAINDYTVTFHADGESLSFDSMTLDTASLFTQSFPQQPFHAQSAVADLARWMYPFNADPAGRPTASVFGALGNAPDFDSRDAQYLLGWNTTNRIPAGQGARNYLLRRARVTLTIATGSNTYTGTLRDYRTYLPTNDLSPEVVIRQRAYGWATCPFTQAGFVRIVSNPAFSRDAVQPREAIQVLSANTVAKDHAFWPDDLPFAAAVAFAGLRLIGHQQVADAYLLGLALRRGGRLATLDERIAALTEPKSPERKALETLT